MTALHRLQWIDAQVRRGGYPNAKHLAEHFEISRRQAQRDFDYMRDSLGAPLVYDALRRGYRYARDTYVLPGPFVTPEQRSLLRRLADYYSGVAAQGREGSAVFAEMADLFGLLSGGARGSARGSPSSKSTVIAGRVAFRAVLAAPGASPPPALESYLREAQKEGDGSRLVCEFHDPEQFLAAVLSAGLPLRVEWPSWLRRRLLDQLRRLQRLNEQTRPDDVADVTRGVTPLPLAWDSDDLARERVPRAGERGRRRPSIVDVTAKTGATQARFEPNWISYVGALRGVLRPAALSDLDTSQLMGLTGMSFHLVMHEACDPSSVTVYDWNGHHLAGLDRVGVLSESFLAMPNWNVFPAACRRAVERIKESIDRGIGAVIWGVDVPEFGVVFGYDDTDGVFLVHGVGGIGKDQSAPILYENVGRSCEVPILYYLIPIERVDYDPDRSYRQSLQFYAEHMERQANAASVSEGASAYKNGLLAYDSWARALESGAFVPMGLRYATSAYAEAKRHAAHYLAWLAGSWGRLPHLAEIARAMEDNARVYGQMLEVLEATDDGAHLGRPVSPAQAASLALLVRQARRIEERSVGLVKRALAEDKSGER